MINQAVVAMLVLVLVTVGLIFVWATLANRLLKTAVTNKYIPLGFILLTLAGIFWVDAIGAALVELRLRPSEWALSMNPTFAFRTIADLFWTTGRILGLVGIIVLIIGIILDLTASRKKQA